MLDTQSQTGLRLLIGEDTLDTGTGLRTQLIFSVPPRVFRVVVTLVEGGLQTVEVGVCCQLSQVSAIRLKWKVLPNRFDSSPPILTLCSVHFCW